jgi:hypothetical protein
MKINKWFHIFIVFLLLIYSCSSEKNESELTNDLKISLSKDSTEVILSNIPAYVMDEFMEDSLDYNLWTNFFAVYKDTTDQEMRDFRAALQGTYTIVNGTIRFKPTSVWSSNEYYFARCYTKTLLRKPEDIISTRKINSPGGFIEFEFRAKK